MSRRRRPSGAATSGGSSSTRGRDKDVGEGHKGHIVEQSPVDLTEMEKRVNCSLKLWCEGINSRDCLRVFHRMRLTNDKCQTLSKKWASLADAHEDVKTADGNIIRLFCVATASRKKARNKKTDNAQQL